MAVLGYTLNDISTALGFPSGYLDVGGDIPMEEKLRVLAREFDVLDVDALKRINAGGIQKEGIAINIPVAAKANDLTDTMAALIEARNDYVGHPRDVFLKALMKRIDDIENGPKGSAQS